MIDSIYDDPLYIQSVNVAPSQKTTGVANPGGHSRRR